MQPNASVPPSRVTLADLADLMEAQWLLLEVGQMHEAQARRLGRSGLLTKAEAVRNRAPRYALAA